MTHPSGTYHKYSFRRAASLLLCSSAWLVFTLFATACADEGTGLLEQIPIELATKWAESETRATISNQFKGGEEITVMGSGKTRTYSAATNGNLQPGKSGFLYWTRTDTMHISAYYAPVQPLTSTFKIETGQNRTETGNAFSGFERSDVLYATPTVVNYGQTATLTFRHLTALVNLTVTASEEVGEVNLSKAYIFFVNQQNVSGTVNRTTGAVAQRTLSTSNYRVTPEGVGTATADAKQVRALLVPQKGSGVDFITVQFRDEDNTITASYSYLPSASQPINLEAGKAYTFNLTLTLGGLTLNTVSVTAWNGSTDKVSSSDCLVTPSVPDSPHWTGTTDKVTSY
jgi:hypothetical protein